MHQSLNEPASLLPQVVSLSHIGGRSTQQDNVWPSADQSILFDEQADLLLVVADGAGGHKGGEVASQLAIKTIVAQYATLGKQQAPKQALLNAIHEGHETIQDRQLLELDKQEMASTVVALALVLSPDEKEKDHQRSYEIYVANVGDSRAYLYRPHSGLIQLSQDHTLVQEEVRKQQLTPEEAKIHPLRHRLSQALGGKKELDIFATEAISPEPYDRYLLCTDGLTDTVDDARIQAILSEQAPTKQVAQALMTQALLEAKDNVSFVLLDMMPAPTDERQEEHVAASGTPFLARRMIALLCILLVVALTVAVLLNFLADELSFTQATLEVNDNIHAIGNTGISPTKPSPPSAIPTARNQPTASAIPTEDNEPTASNTVLPSATPALNVNAEFVGQAATAIPTPTSTPPVQIVEYRTGDDRIVFESMVGWGGQGRTCDDGSLPLNNLIERLDYPYEQATRPVVAPIVEQRGRDIYVKFDAIATTTRACRLESYHERVILQSAAPQSEWIIKNARRIGQVIPLDDPSDNSPSGWMIRVEWLY